MPTGATPQADPNVKMPAAVRNMAAKADELYGQLYSKDPAKTVDPAVPQDPPADPKPQDPPADPPADPKPQDPPAPQDSPAADTTAEPKGGWEHAFKSMKGRYEQARQTNQGLLERINGLEMQLAAVQEHANARVAAPADHAAPSALTKEEVDAYGEDFLKVVEKQAGAAAAKMVQSLQTQVADLQNQLRNVGQTVTKSARQEMKDKLAQAVPNWEQINHSADFHEWLALRDPFSGDIRHVLLKKAWSANEADRVLAFFKGFLATSEAAVAPVDTRPDPAQTPSGKVPLETFAAPGRAKPAADNPSPAEKKPFISTSEITKFYADKAAGRWRGREKEADAFEAQIFAAQREGRVTK